MKDSKVTKRALFSSVMSSSLCVSMLIGTTFAWFTDSVETGVNKIQSGTLAIDLIHENGGADNEDVSIKHDNPQHTIFNYDKWEPGYTQVETLTIKNEGRLALQYELNAIISGGDTGPKGEKLSDAIDVYMSFGEEKVNGVKDLSNTDKWWKIGTLTEWLDGENLTSGKMLPNGAPGADLSQGITSGSCTVTVALHMRESAENVYQNLSLGEVKLILNATQWTYEPDNINNRYDAAAAAAAWDGEEIREVTPVDNTYSVSHPAELAWIAQQVNGNINDFTGKTIKLTSDLDLKNMNWTPIGTFDNAFNGTFDGNNYTIFNVKVEDDNTKEDDFACAGFFGVTYENAVIKDLTLENVVISSEGKVVAGAVAYPVGTELENITVTGLVQIEGGHYTAGIIGHSRSCYDANNLTLNGTTGSYIRGVNAVGGILSEHATGKGTTYSNLNVSNITIEGNKMVGGIVGLITGDKLSGCTVNNVTLISDTSSRVLAGTIAGTKGDDSHELINCSATNVTAQDKFGKTVEIKEVGGYYGG